MDAPVHCSRENNGGEWLHKLYEQMSLSCCVRHWFDQTGFDLDSAQPQFQVHSSLEGQSVFVAHAARRGSIGRLPARSTRTETMGTVLITGRLGGIGLATAKWLNECHSVSGLVLTSHSGSVSANNAFGRQVVDQLGSEMLEHFEMIASDVSRIDHATKLLAPNSTVVPQSLVEAVVLCDSTDAGPECSVEVQQFSSFLVTASAVDGAYHLHRLTQQTARCRFVIHSSVIGTFGLPGQSAQASANTALESFVSHCVGLGRAAIGVQWAAWSQQFSSGTNGGCSEPSGMVGVSISTGLRILQAAWGGACSLTVAQFDPHVALLPGVRGLIGGLDHMLKQNQKQSLSSTKIEHGKQENSGCDLRSQEQALARIESRIRESVGMSIEVDEALGHHGMDSLAAIELRSSLQQELSGAVQLPTNLLTECPTIASILEFLTTTIRSHQSDAQTKQSLHLDAHPVLEAALLHCPANAESVWELSEQQEQMWILYEFTRNAQYNMPILLLVDDGCVDDIAMRGALQVLTAKHDVLRAVYQTTTTMESGARQVVAPAHVWRAVYSSCRGVHSKQSVEEELLAECGTPIDLCTSGAMRVLSVHSTEYWLLLTLHHIACDGVSIRPLFKDLTVAYEQLMLGSAPACDSLAVQYLDWSHWQNACLSWGFSDGQTRLQEGLTFWQAALGGSNLPVLQLDATTSSGFASQSISVRVAAGLHKLADERAVTAMHAMLALWSVLLCNHASQREVVVGIPYANRENANLLSSMVRLPACG